MMYQRKLARAGLRCCAFLLMLSLLAGCREEIVQGLSEREANRIIARLYTEGFEAKKVRHADGLWAISVADAEAVPAISLLESRRLLRPNPLTAEPSAGVLQSREQGRVQYERALSVALESTVGALPGVLEARVHLNLPTVDPLLGMPVKGSTGSASVLILHRFGYAVSSSDVSRLVAGAAGVPEGQVRVLLTPITEQLTNRAVDGVTTIPTVKLQSGAPESEAAVEDTGVLQVPRRTVSVSQQLFPWFFSLLCIGGGLFLLRRRPFEGGKAPSSYPSTTKGFGIVSER